MLIKCQNGYITQESARLSVNSESVAIVGEDSDGTTNILMTDRLMPLLPLSSENAQTNKYLSRMNELIVSNLEKILADLKDVIEL